jgi:hypothetical protein
MAIEPGLQLADPLLQLGNSLQSLAQGMLQKQDVSLHLWGKFRPSLWTNRSCFHKTLNTPLFTKELAPKGIFFQFFKKNCLSYKGVAERLQLSDRLHSNDSHLTDLANQIINKIKPDKLNCNFSIPLGSVCLDLENDKGVIVDHYECLKKLIERKSTKAHGVILFKTYNNKPVDPIQMTLMSEKGDNVLKGIEERILKAKDQLSISKPGLICCFLQDIDDYELKMLSNKSGLQIMTSSLLNRKDFNHIAAISYCSENVIQKKANVITHSNLGLTFRNDNCKFGKVNNYEFLGEING